MQSTVFDLALADAFCQLLAGAKADRRSLVERSKGQQHISRRPCMRDDDSRAAKRPNTSGAAPPLEAPASLPPRQRQAPPCQQPPLPRQGQAPTRRQQPARQLNIPSCLPHSTHQLTLLRTSC